MSKIFYLVKNEIYGRNMNVRVGINYAKRSYCYDGLFVMYYIISLFYEKSLLCNCLNVTKILISPTIAIIRMYIIKWQTKKSEFSLILHNSYFPFPKYSIFLNLFNGIFILSLRISVCCCEFPYALYIRAQISYRVQKIWKMNKI